MSKVKLANVSTILIFTISLFLNIEVYASDGSDYLVGAIFQPGWTKGAEANGQLLNDELKKRYCGREPINGWYENDKYSMVRNIKQAKNFGLDYFMFNYFHYGQNAALYFKSKREKASELQKDLRKNALKKILLEQKNAKELNMAFHNFLSSPNTNDMKFAIQYTNGQKMHNIFNAPKVWRKDPWELQVLEWIQYFKRDNYLIVDGKPVFSINAFGKMRSEFEIGSDKDDKRVPNNFMYKTVREALDKLQLLAKSNGFPKGVHIVATFADNKFKEKGEMGFTAGSSYNIGDYGLKDCIRGKATEEELATKQLKQLLPYRELINAGTKRWWDLLGNTAGLKVLPTVVVGYDNRPWRVGKNKRKCFIPASQHNPKNFKKFLLKAKKVIDLSNGVAKEKGWESRILGSNMILISAWNEFGMGSVLAPTYLPGSGKAEYGKCKKTNNLSEQSKQEKAAILESNHYKQFGFLRQVKEVFGD